MPSETWPNTVYWLSSDGWSARTMKNCAPALSGFPGTSTAATDPRVIFGARASAFTAFRPPVPYSARLAGSLVSGSPPWTMPYFTTR